jgi:hypothetical protein
MLPPPLSTAPLKEREFLGRKIYSMSMAMPTEAPAGEGNEKEEDDAKETPRTNASAQTFSFTSSAGYVAFSTDDSILEEYLRSGENPPKALRAVPGLAEAAQQAGGMDRGHFNYDNQLETMRVTMEALQSDPDAFNQTILSRMSAAAADGEHAFTRLFDIKLLPSFDRIAKYFGITVASAGTDADGFSLKAVSPAPAGLRK